MTEVVEGEDAMVIYIDWLGHRLLRCGLCRQACLKVHGVRPEREWRDPALRTLLLNLRYRSRRVECPRCEVRVENFPWARVTMALSNAVAVLARELSWQGHCAPLPAELEERGPVVKRAVNYVCVTGSARPSMCLSKTADGDWCSASRRGTSR